MTTVQTTRAISEAVTRACLEAGIRPPSSINGDIGSATVTVTWTPDLTPAEQTTLTTLQSLAVGSTLITPTERANIDPDIQGLITFQGIATPTLAQTVSAVKAQSRILRAILRS